LWGTPNVSHRIQSTGDRSPVSSSLAPYCAVESSDTAPLGDRVVLCLPGPDGSPGSCSTQRKTVDQALFRYRYRFIVSNILGALLAHCAPLCAAWVTTSVSTRVSTRVVTSFGEGVDLTRTSLFLQSGARLTSLWFAREPQFALDSIAPWLGKTFPEKSRSRISGVRKRWGATILRLLVSVLETKLICPLFARGAASESRHTHIVALS
jgi:hypothetical protein